MLLPPSDITSFRNLLMHREHRHRYSKIEHGQTTGFDAFDENTRDIIQRLQDLNVGLPALMKSEHAATQQFIADQLSQLRSDLMIDAHYNKVLDSLFFPEMTSRFEDIEPAHRRTYEWIFKDEPNTQMQWDDFNHWLKSSDDIYWVIGKPGSGKSTLMRFINEHEATEKAISAWSEPLTCARAAFSLWNPAATDLQKNACGLFRTLLYQIIKQHPFLAAEVVDPAEQHIMAWSEERLVRTLLRLLNSIKNQLRIIFFIDGLDELEGDTRKLTRKIKDLSQAGAKLCVSSRPWQEFEAAFGTKSSLRLHDLTQHDMEVFVQERICLAQTEFTDFDKMSSSERNEVTVEIVGKADGVFLWTTFAMKTVEEAMSYGDNYQDLLQRIKTLPPELENLYEHLLQRIRRNAHQTDRIEAARYFQVLLMANYDLTLLDVALLTLQHSDEASLEGMTSSEVMLRRCRRTRARVLQRCCGLICFTSGRNWSKSEDITGNDVVDILASCDEPRLEFLHRTVKEFIVRGDILSSLEAGAKDSWHPYAALATAHCRRLQLDSTYIKSEHVNIVPDDGMVDFMVAMEYLRFLDTSDSNNLSAQLALSVVEAARKKFLLISEEARKRFKEREISWVQEWDLITSPVEEICIVFLLKSLIKQYLEEKVMDPTRMLRCTMEGLWGQEYSRWASPTADEDFLWLFEALIREGADVNEVRRVPVKLHSGKTPSERADEQGPGITAWMRICDLLLHRPLSQRCASIFVFLVQSKEAHVNALLRTAWIPRVFGGRKVRTEGNWTLRPSILVVEISPLSVVQCAIRDIETGYGFDTDRKSKTLVQAMQDLEQQGGRSMMVIVGVLFSATKDEQGPSSICTLTVDATVTEDCFVKLHEHYEKSPKYRRLNASAVSPVISQTRAEPRNHPCEVIDSIDALNDLVDQNIRKGDLEWYTDLEALLIHPNSSLFRTQLRHSLPRLLNW